MGTFVNKLTNMKNIISILTTFLSVNIYLAQCNADFDFGEQAFGISPDFSIGESLADGFVNQEYNDVIHMLIPQYALDVDSTLPLPATMELDSIELINITLIDVDNPTVNLYPEDLGLELTCNNNGDSGNPCSFLGNNQYCAVLTGVPTISGSFECSITINGWVTVFGSPFSQEASFDGINLYIGEENIVLGCTDSLALNYNPDANQDDGSCEYENECINSNYQIQAGNYYYYPNELNISVGESVSWFNTSGYHDVNGAINSITGETFDNPELFSLNAINSGNEGECIGVYVFNQPGIYNYDCSIGNHALNGMVGTIIVGNPGCIDQQANNYDENADFSDNSCCYVEFESQILHPECFSESGTISNSITTLEPNLDVVFTLNNGDENSSGEFIVGAGNYIVTLNYVDPNYENCATSVEVQVVDPDPLSLEISVTEASVMGNAIGTAYVTGGIGEYNVIWLNENNEEVDPNDLPEGNYTVIATDDNNCEIDGEVEVIYNSIEDALNKSFELYPNPTSDILYINPRNIQDYTITIFDQFGRQVYYSKSYNSLRISLGEFENGIYYASINTVNGQIIKKISLTK